MSKKLIKKSIYIDLCDYKKIELMSNVQKKSVSKICRDLIDLGVEGLNEKVLTEVEGIHQANIYMTQKSDLLLCKLSGGSGKLYAKLARESIKAALPKEKSWKEQSKELSEGEKAILIDFFGSQMLSFREILDALKY